MQLFLATDHPWNTVYTDASGAPWYKTQTPLKLHDRTTSISKVIDPDIPRRAPEPDASNNSADGIDTARFASLAQIDWRVIKSSVIHFGGRELATNEFFRKAGTQGVWGRPRLFSGLDGKEYKWILGTYTSELKLNDGSETIVAHYRHKKFGIPFQRIDRPSLEVSTAFEHMLDEILSSCASRKMAHSP
ncbi:hypothetical protein B0H11DRAFT_1212546 [Mycena galericulata]|nr:hypothetical protein B0H11DRAFT_1212546 [Mycena galericulata]